MERVALIIGVVIGEEGTGGRDVNRRADAWAGKDRMTFKAETGQRAFGLPDVWRSLA